MESRDLLVGRHDKRMQRLARLLDIGWPTTARHSLNVFWAVPPDATDQPVFGDILGWAAQQPQFQREGLFLQPKLAVDRDCMTRILYDRSFALQACNWQIFTLGYRTKESEFFGRTAGREFFGLGTWDYCRIFELYGAPASKPRTLAAVLDMLGNHIAIERRKYELGPGAAEIPRAPQHT